VGKINTKKLKQLINNTIIPGSGIGVVYLLSFGFSWWTIPISFLMGFVISLAITKPNQLEIAAPKDKLQLKQASFPLEVENNYYG
jgi:hypothetical protein